MPASTDPAAATPERVLSVGSRRSSRAGRATPPVTSRPPSAQSDTPELADRLRTLRGDSQPISYLCPSITAPSPITDNFDRWRRCPPLLLPLLTGCRSSFDDGSAQLATTADPSVNPAHTQYLNDTIYRLEREKRQILQMAEDDVARMRRVVDQVPLTLLAYSRCCTYSLLLSLRVCWWCWLRFDVPVVQVRSDMMQMEHRQQQMEQRMVETTLSRLGQTPEGHALPYVNSPTAMVRGAGAMSAASLIGYANDGTVAGLRLAGRSLWAWQREATGHLVHQWMLGSSAATTATLKQSLELLQQQVSGASCYRLVLCVLVLCVLVLCVLVLRCLVCPAVR